MSLHLAGEPIVGALMLGGALVVGAVELFVNRPKRRKIWQQAATELGLNQEGTETIGGQIDEMWINVTVEYDSDAQHYTTKLKISTDENNFNNLSVSSYGLMTGMFRRMGSAQVMTGDHSFDSNVLVGQEHPYPVALLSFDIRHQLRHLIADKGMIEDSTLTHIYSTRPSSTIELVNMVQDSLTLVKQLAREQSEAPELYAKNTLTDPEQAVSNTNFQLLTECKWAPLKLIEQTAQKIVNHQNPELSLRAMLYLSRQGQPTQWIDSMGKRLLDCRHHTEDEKPVDYVLQCDVMDRLAEAEQIDVLHAMLASDCLETACHAAILLQSHGNADSVPFLLNHLKPVEGEGVFHKATLQVAICDALATLGHKSTISALQSLADSAFYKVSPSAQKAASKAVTAIQSRLKGAGAGQLTVIDEQSSNGALTLTEVNDGNLSLPENIDQADG